MPRPELQLLVCTNERDGASGRSCCAARGGLEVYRAIKDAVRSRGLKARVLATRTGCLHHCSHGVTMVVWPGNLWYRGVTVDRVDEILEAALEGRAVEELVMPNLPWE